MTFPNTTNYRYILSIIILSLGTYMHRPFEPACNATHDRHCIDLMQGQSA